MDKAANFLFITHVEQEGPFLKVWGQVDKATAINVEQALLRTTPHFEKGYSCLSSDNLQNGVLCCAKYKDTKYYRARIIGTDQLAVNGYVEVSFVDFGNRDAVPSADLRSMQNFTSSFISLPPLATNFLLAETVCATGEWNELFFQEIAKELRYTEVNYTLVAQAVKHLFVRLSVNGQDLAVNYISRGLLARTSLHTQEAVLLTMLSKQPAAVAAAATVPQQAVPTIATYKAFTLEPGTQHPVYVSYISDGPCHFSVQLKHTEDVLVKLMNDINSMPLKMLEECPLPGTVCVARCIEDGHICRAVVTNEVDSQFKVFYVDFGNSEVVPLEALFQIPFKYVIPKVMAIRFALAGIEKSTLTIEMKCAFKQFVDNRLLYMKVIPAGQRTALPKCDLFDPVTKTSALDVLHRAAVNAYPEPPALNRGFSQPVRVSYVFSCNRFYVQLKSKESELTQLMVDLQESCLQNNPMNPEHVKEGLPCCALFEGDGQWYRSQIVGVCDDNTVKVRYIDYGNEEIVPIGLLKLVEGEQLTVLRPQAIECCLNGYQNMGEDQERDNLLEEIILEKEFTMKVIEMQNGRALVDLIDSSNYNVASLLLEKIASARSQVSPMLVQAGNRIEHRKSLTDKKPVRDSSKGWNEKTNDSTSWRQENKDKPFRNREPNDQSNEPSWRQNKDNNSRFNKTGGGRSFDDNTSAPAADNSWGDASPQQNDTGGDIWDNNRNSDRSGYKKKDRNDDSNKNYADKGGGYGFKGRNQDRSQDRNKNPKWDNNRSDGNKKEWDNKSNDSWGSKGDDTKKRGGSDWGDKGKGEKWGDKNEDKGGGAWNDRGKSKWDKGTERGESWGDKGKGGKWGDKSESWNKGDRKDGRYKGNNDNWGQDGGDKPSKWQNDDNKENSFEKKSSWDADSPRTGGQGFKKNFGRENSELSPSGSDRGYQKGGKTGKFEPRNQRSDRPPPKSSLASAGEDVWGASAPADVFDAAPSTAMYKLVEVGLGTEVKVSMCWFHNPTYFYVQLSEYENQLKTMMEEIQVAYKTRKPGNAVCNAPVISIFPEDKVLYRARVLELSGSSYKVFYVDFGNVAVVDQVWPIETKFMELPGQAVCCGLNSIEPVNEHWEDASTYSQYFDKESFQCNFIANDKGRYLVDMTVGNCSIAELLARDCLAKNNVKPERKLSIELTLYQQIWVVLRSINSLSDILIETSRNELMKCSVHMLNTAQETYIQNLQAYLNQKVIVDVYEIVDDTLVVMFFDGEHGTKIQLIEPDELTVSISILLEHPVLSEEVHGFVSEIIKDVAYVQPNEYLEDLKSLEDELTKTYSNLPDEVNVIVIPHRYSYYALKDEDQIWRRVMVLDTLDESDEDYQVQFIDHGRITTVNYTKLIELMPEFGKQPKFCFPVMLNNLVFDQRLELKGANIILRGIQPKQYENQNGFNVRLIDGRGGPFNMRPLDEDELLLIPIDETHVQVNVSHVDTPNEFYLQKLQDIASINEIQRKLQLEVENLPELENAAVGARCAAPYSLDEQWYRAEVLDADEDITTVRFIDYGNTDVLSNDSVKVRALSPDMLSTAVHATRCSLRATPIDEEWNPDATQCLSDLLDVPGVTARFIDQDEKTNYVELYHKGISMREVLVSRKLAHDCAELLEGQTGFVSHINSPSEFFIQLECYSSELERFSEQLSDAENFPELVDLSPGSLCAAMYLDEQWYRARILSNTIAGIEVLYIDFGNSSMSSNLRQLPEDLALPPPLAQKCSLLKPPTLVNWSPQAASKFSEIAADGQTVFTVDKLSSGETSIVSLLLDGEDIVNMLCPESVVGCVVNVKSLDCFDVMINGETIESVKLETVPGTVWSEESNEDFQEVLRTAPKDIEIEFVDESTVRLYSKGEDVRLNISRTRVSNSQTTDLTSEVEANDEIYTDEHVQAIEEQINSSSEHIQPTDEQINTSDEHVQAIDEQINTCDRDVRAAQNVQTIEEQVNSSEEHIQQIDEQINSSDEHAQTVEEQINSSNEHEQIIEEQINSSNEHEQTNTSAEHEQINSSAEHEQINSSAEHEQINSSNEHEQTNSSAEHEQTIEEETNSSAEHKQTIEEETNISAESPHLAHSDPDSSFPGPTTGNCEEEVESLEECVDTHNIVIPETCTEEKQLEPDDDICTPKTENDQGDGATTDNHSETGGSSPCDRKAHLSDSEESKCDGQNDISLEAACDLSKESSEASAENVVTQSQQEKSNDSGETTDEEISAPGVTSTPEKAQSDTTTDGSPAKSDIGFESAVQQTASSKVSPDSETLNDNIGEGFDQKPTDITSLKDKPDENISPEVGGGDTCFKLTELNGLTKPENVTSPEPSPCPEGGGKEIANATRADMKLILNGIVDDISSQPKEECPPVSPHRVKNSDEQILPGVISQPSLADSHGCDAGNVQSN